MRSRLPELSLFLWLVLPAGLWAGLHHTTEPPPQRTLDCGQFLDRLMVLKGYGPADPTLNKEDAPNRKQYLGFIAQLRQKRLQGTHTADDTANLGYYLIRVRGTPPEPNLYLMEAIDLLVPASRQYPTHFQIHANLGTAFHLLESTEALKQAEDYLALAVELASPEWREYEQTHLRLVKTRRRSQLQAVRRGSFGQASVPEPDNILTISPEVRLQFIGPSGKWEIGKLAPAELAKLPEGSINRAMEHVQQLIIWLPYDARLLWLFGELAHLQGQPRAAYRAINDASMNNTALRDIRLRVLLLGEYLYWYDVISRSSLGTDNWLAQNIGAGLLFTTPGDPTAFLSWSEHARNGIKVPGGFDIDPVVPTEANPLGPVELWTMTPRHWLFIALGGGLMLFLLGVQFREWRRRRARRTA